MKPNPKGLKVLIILMVIIIAFSGCKSQKTSSDTTQTDSEISSLPSASTITESVNTDSDKESSSKESSKKESSNKESSNKERGSKTQASSKTQNSSSSNNSSNVLPTYRNPTSDGEVKEEEMAIIKAEIKPVSPALNEKVTLANDKVLKVSENYVKYNTAEFYGSGDVYKPNSIEFRWSCDKAADSYILKISTDKNLKNAEEYSVPNTKTFSLYNLYAGKTYYWQITAKCENGIAKSEIFTFEIAQTVRTINIEGVSNTRDIGGYLTESGKRVKQGMVYRAASLDGINTAGRDAAIYKYRIKTDLDLRKANEGSSGTRSPIDSNINYLHFSGSYYWSMISDKANWDNIKKAVDSFANPDNYPIIVHCSVGRDRTGTMCLLINGLLGVSKEDLFLDYELSFLSKAACGEGHVSYVESMVNKFGNMYDNLAVYGGEDDKPFSTHVEKYLLDIGVSQKNIDKIKANMLE